MPIIEIDGKSINAEQGATIIEVADRLAIPIPRFCYHRKLSVAANCRMCLVQVEKAPKPLPACATPIADGMKIWTKSKETIAAQRAVMEFLLINHPLDCPICDQGGECELQDVAIQYGQDKSRYSEAKRSVLDHNLGPLIATEMTRCIHCTRCVRFGEEISGERELGASGRGEFMEIGTFIEQNVNSEVSGNVIDLCPVGALTSKPFRFRARAWELNSAPAISPHDCIGANLQVHTYQENVMRVVPQDTEDLNEVWLSDRDRFSYEGLLHEDRLRKPMLCKQGTWRNVAWIEALQFSVAGLKLTIDTYGADKLGVLVSPSATTEEYYLLQKFTRAFGSNNIDHRLRQLDFTDQELAPTYPNLGIEFRELEQQEMLLLIGCNIAKEQPLASLRIRHMVKHGGTVAVINPVDYEFNFAVQAKLIVPGNDLLKSVATVVKSVAAITNYVLDAHTNNVLAKIHPSAQDQQFAQNLLHGKKRQIIFGQLITGHPQASTIIALANLLAQMLQASCGYFSDGANAAGAWLSGCVPHRTCNGVPISSAGKNAYEMLQQPLNCYILYGIEPEFDTALGVQTLATLQQADFVLAISSYQSENLLKIADVILPMALFVERAGSLININGTKQELVEAVPAFGESRPGWKILRMLGDLAGFAGFTQNTLAELRTEVWSQLVVPTQLPRWQTQIIRDFVATNSARQLTRIAPIALYAIDGLVRRATALQATKDAHQVPTIEINQQTATNLNIATGELVQVSSEFGSSRLKTVINTLVADFTAVIYQGHNQTIALGVPYTPIEVKKC